MPMLRTARLAGVALAAAVLLPTTPALGATHLVAPGETLWGIALSNGLPASVVATANGLSPEARVVAGSSLTIPARGAAPAAVSAAPAAGAPAATPAPASGGGLRVRWGDTLSAIAARNGISLSRLAAANGLDPSRPLLEGTSLRLPASGGAGSTAAPAATTSAAPAPIGAYKVRVGDTLSALAARSRVPLTQMAFMNGLDPSKPLLAGTVIKLPTGSPVTSSAPAPQRTIVPSAPPDATPGRLSASQIGSIAAQHGAPGSLATAIAWQESGFNNAMLSGANARGVMQILPGTWQWVQANLARTRLNPESAEDNVRAGSLYLADLMRQTNGDPAMAAAAYYQGLSSVRRIGMLPETRRYVANVLALRARFGG
jgi:N-acetylmuramoyl-L-alanine amidase